MMVLHTVVVAADQMAVVADQMVVAELELHTEVVVQKSVVDFGLIGSMRSRDFGLIEPMGSRDFGLIGTKRYSGTLVQFPLVPVR